jgi:hypothetical protein
VTVIQPAKMDKLLKQPDDSDTALVANALQLLSVGSGYGGAAAAKNTAASDDTISDSDTEGDASTAAGVLKVVQTEANKLLWMVRLLPQSQQVVPFEYTVQWPSGHTLVLE